MTKKSIHSEFIAILVIAGLVLTLYFGDTQSHPGAAAALGLGLILWLFVVDLPQSDAPFGLVLGGAMGIIEWQDGFKFWCGFVALTCLWCAHSMQRNRQVSD